MKTKPCIKCGAADRYADGDCRPCTIRQTRAYRMANLEKVKRARRKYYESNIDAVKRKARDYAAANPERVRMDKHARRGWAPGEPERAEKARLHVKACACCGSPSPRTKLGWFADHNHSTGKFRAYLCHPCNSTVGFVEKYGLEKSSQVAVYLALYEK